MFSWLIYFFIAWGISWSLNFFLIYWAKKKSKKGWSRRLGGLAVGVSFLFSVLMITELEWTLQFKGLFLGVVFILIFGVWDDFRNLSWRSQLIFQLFLGFLLIIFGFQIDFITGPLGGMIRMDSWKIDLGWRLVSVFSSLLIMTWIVLLINSLNWSDGIDGILGAITSLGLLAIFFVSLIDQVNQPAIAILALVFLGSVLGFWWFNFPPGKIEAGTTGSYLCGFFLASLSIIAGTKIATTLLVISLVIADALRVIILRVKAGQSIFAKDKFSRHLHYELRSRGWSDRQIVFFYLFFLSFFLFIPFLGSSRLLKLVFIFLEVIILILFLWYIDNTKIKKITHKK